MHLKMSSTEVVCCKYLPNITDKLSIETNIVDPDQTAPICFLFQQTRKADDFCCDWRTNG